MLIIHLKMRLLLILILLGIFSGVLFASDLLITRQLASLEVVKGGTIKILPDYLEVEGVTNPEDLQIIILEGENYSFSGDTVFADSEFLGEIHVNLQVSESEFLSNIFNLSIYIIGGESNVEFANGGFELGDKSNWSSRNELSTLIVSADTAASEVYSGRYALRIDYIGLGYLRTSGTTYFNVVQGYEYEMVFYAKSSKGGSAWLVAMTSGGNDPLYDHKEPFTISQNWERYSYKLTSPITGTFGCKFEFSTIDTFWLDNIYLIETRYASLPFYYSDVYVSSTEGNDSNDGSKASPVKTISQALSGLQKGSRVILREGRYHEENVVSITGSESAPVTISAYPGEEAILDGTVVVDGTWEHQEGNIWKIRITNQEVLNYGAQQIWIDGRMMKVARWPNNKGTFADDFNFDYTAREPEPGTNWDMETTFVSLEDDFSLVSADSDIATWKSEGIGIQSLGGTGIDFTGAMVALKMGYETVLEEIVSHAVGDDIFVSSSTEGKNRNELLTLGKQYFYILAHKDCLDDADEWYFDASTNDLYLYTADGQDPGGKELRMKTQNLALQINNSSYVILDNLNFFGTHFRVENSINIEINNSIFEYPSYYPAMLKTRTLSYSPHIMTNSSIRVFNCEFRYFDGTALYFDGSNTYAPVLENTLLHNGRFNHMVNFFKCKGGYAAHNTVYVSERGNGIKFFKSPYGHFVAEYNYMHNLATHRSDASCIQVQSGSQNYDTLRYNWFHDTENKGIRFDGEPAGRLGTMFANVGWDLWQGLQVKGDSQNVVNNTFFDCSKRCDITVLAAEDFGGNDGTWTYNNAAERMSGHRVRTVVEYPLPGNVGNNWNGFITGLDIATVIRDPENWDFRPQDGSDLVDKGYILEPFVKDWIGESRDIGAYEFGDTIYWIPGRKAEKATMPIPPNGTASAMADCDLMWLEALGTKKHRVYLGNSTSNMELVSEQHSNIYNPGDLDPTTTYFWRVDEVLDDGIVTGDTWYFVPNGTQKDSSDLPVSYLEDFNKSDDDANFEPWDENIWEPEYMTQDSTYVVNDSLKIWPAAGRIDYANYFKLKGINMILRPHPFMEFHYNVPEGINSIPVALNVNSEGLSGTPVLFDILISESNGWAFININEVFENWDQENPDKEWKHLQDIDVWFFPETNFNGTEEITIDDFMLGFRCLTKRDFDIEIIGQDTIITEVGIPFYMSVDKLELGLISTEFPEEIFLIVDPYALPGLPKVNVSEAPGFENNSNIITPTALNVNPILVPVVVEIGEKQSGTYDFKVFIHEIPVDKNDMTFLPLKIYPNPFDHGFFLENAESVERLKIYNMSGVLLRSVGEATGFINMDGFDAGVYLIEVQFRNGDRQHSKLIKK